MIYTVYKVTNLINGKIYIGVHGTENPNDSYLGSGKRICRARDKYGDGNFSKDILFEFNDKSDAYKKEAELVTPEFVARPDTYNINLGGFGGGENFVKGELYVENREGNRFRVKNTDPRYLSGELKHVGSKKGKVRLVHVVSGEQKEVDSSLREMMLSQGWVMWSKGFMRFKDSLGEEYYLQKDDPKIEELSLVPWTKGMKVMRRGGDIVHVREEDITDDMISIVKYTATVKDREGNYLRVSVDDPRIKSGELVGVNKGKEGLADHLNVKNCVCEHCGIVTTKGNISRWHNDRCKFKNQS